MKKIVVNASPLIFLAKLERLSFLDPFQLVIPEAVYQELFIGDRPEQDLIRNFLHTKDGAVLQPKRVHEGLLPPYLGEGEKAVISLALEKKIPVVLLDDHRARMMARSFKLKTKGTLGILLQQLYQKKISSEEGRRLFQQLLQSGFRISEDLLLRVWSEFER